MNPKHSEWTEEYSVGNLPALKETVWAILQHLKWTVDYSVGNQRALRETVWAATGAPRTADSGPLSLCVLWLCTTMQGGFVLYAKKYSVKPEAQLRITHFLYAK